MKWVKFILGISALLFLIYFVGPTPEKGSYGNAIPAIPASSVELEQYIAEKEGAHKLKSDNQARIVWADENKKEQTAYAIVYLHGFSASQGEGSPLHQTIAKKFGCNLYLARLAEHGVDTVDQLIHLTATNYWESAKEAYAIGKRLGKKVILMGTSTGASNALQLAATFSDVHALVLLSPNIEINNENAWIANNPWGLYIGRYMIGAKEFTPGDTTQIYKKYWNTPYRLEAIVALQEYLETTMIPSTFQKITQPTLLLYYYKNEKEQDTVVKVGSMLKMFDQLSTPAALKKAFSIPNAADHVIGGSIKSKDVLSVENAITAFFNTTLQLPVKR